MSTPILSINGLTTSFRVEGKWLPVVRNVSFDIGRGETVAVVGESATPAAATASITLLIACVDIPV